MNTAVVDNEEVSGIKLTRNQKVRLFILLCLTSFLLGLAIDLYVPSLPSILRYYHTNETLVEYSIGLFMIGSSVGQTIFGVLSDCYGRKIVLKICLIGYILVSFFILLSPNIYWFDVWRVFQGVTIAGISVTSRSMCVDLYRGKKLYNYINYFGMFWSLGPILGPFIGGYLQHYFNWKANFVFFTVYGIILLFSMYNIPETLQEKSEGNIKATAINIYSVLSNKSFILCILTGGTCYSMFVMFNTLGPFIVQTIYKFSPVQYGYTALVLGSCYLFGSIGNRLAFNKFSVWTLIHFGVAGVVLSCTTLFVLSFIVHNVFCIIIPVAGVLFFSGFVCNNNISKAVSQFTHLAGTAGALYGTIVGFLISFITYIIGNLGTDFIHILSGGYLGVMLISLTASIIGKRLDKNKDKNITLATGEM